MKIVKIDGIKVEVKEDKDFDKDFAYDGKCPKCEGDDGDIEQYGNCYDMDSQQLECGGCGCKFEIFTNGWNVGIVDGKELKSVYLEHEVRKLLKAIDDNQTSLWGGALVETYGCVIFASQDVADNHDDEDELTKYTGISKEYDKLAELVNYKKEKQK